MERNNDLISRSALLEELEWLKANANESSKAEVEEYIQRVKNAPAVTEKSQWIPVTERLPKGECIAFGYQGEMIMGYLGSEAMGGETLYYAENEGEYLYYVTHWRPLPEPPKEGEDA